MIPLEQRLGCLVIKLRVGSQEFVEGRDVTVKPHGVDDGFHFSADAGDFSQADFVNLVRGQLRGGEMLGETTVDLFTAGQGADTGRSGGRQVIAL